MVAAGRRCPLCSWDFSGRVTRRLVSALAARPSGGDPWCRVWQRRGVSCPGTCITRGETDSTPAHLPKTASERAPVLEVLALSGSHGSLGGGKQQLLAVLPPSTSSRLGTDDRLGEFVGCSLHQWEIEFRALVDDAAEHSPNLRVVGKRGIRERGHVPRTDEVEILRPAQRERHHASEHPPVENVVAAGPQGGQEGCESRHPQSVDTESPARLVFFGDDVARARDREARGSRGTDMK